MRERDKAACGREAYPAAIDSAVFDLRAVNPTAMAKVDERTTEQIIESIQAQRRIASEALARLQSLIEDAA